MQCPKCDETIADDATICPSCGAELSVEEDRPETVETEPEAAEVEAVEPEAEDAETAEPEPVDSGEPEPFGQAKPSDSYKWVFVGASAVLMLLLAFAPWIGLPGSLVSSLESDEIASMVLGFVGVDLHAIAYTLVSGGLAINNNLVPMLRSASELGANFGLDLSAFDAYAGRLQMVGTLLIVLWAVNIAALAYALYCDIAGRKPFRWAYPLLVVTCALVLVVLFVGVQRLTQGGLGETFENMGSFMDFLQPGYWITLVIAIAATVARPLLSRREGGR